RLNMRAGRLDASAAQDRGEVLTVRQPRPKGRQAIPARRRRASACAQQHGRQHRRRQVAR
ncbi:hypothetical protein Q6272_30945, partial [Klebsiella pneumoniae]|uniref:hypothetical protein n=1 Tax=Klebsiella pneumoniae TaxID=573 RepID=UPI00272F3BF8